MRTESEPRLVTIGETMAMVTPTAAESLVTATDFHLDSAGAESNVASHAAALGVPSAWVSAVGDDALGERIRATIGGRGVNTEWVRSDPDAPTGLYVKDPGAGVLYYRRGSAASHMGPASVADLPIDRFDIVHVTGITPALSSSCAAMTDAVIDRCAREGALLSFDINHRAALWPEGVARGALRSLARRADIVFVGLDEAQDLWDCADAADVRRLLPEPGRLIVKDGDVGATEFHGDDAVFCPTAPVDVVEAVGAGDAFAAGYLAALLREPNTDAQADSTAATLARLEAGHKRARLVLRSTSDFVP